MTPAKKKTREETVKDLDSLLETLRTKYGEEAIMKLGDARKVNVDVISTGSLSLDMALGVGGFPKGRIIEIFGPESSGKTTLALSTIARAQAKGGRAAFIDAEHGLDPDYAKKIGVKTNELLISQPNSGEEALNILESLIRSGMIDIVVIDSVAALTPKAEIDGDMESKFIGLQARMMSQALRKITAIAAQSGTIIIFINQLREKIGIMFGNPETTPGGRALKFYSSVRVDIRRKAQLKKGEEVIGSRTKAKVVKNKVAAPFRVAEFDILYGEGISYEGDVLGLALESGLVRKAGASYSFGETKLGVGIEAARQTLKDDKKLLGEMEKAVMKASEPKES
ncbi:MAG: recombinase RecA [Candidatus Colwellbacteria bacterium GWA2_46_10]|uniref:Protein RecA n=1 Tax=Candidatus Colwellbacteria bacterium GWA2_46_10 TaxID=1797684 RepID=A0A1G1YYH9_9BACT|nr:MAG: Protein RecA [Microgenomates group bacterium GW2011_GWA1_Microgenomates_45_10]KKU19530.1 MAG: Protein RecA [Parcubacteria group bacterium GW2011_GWA2_46_10]OGY56467.1 MAG: recombinase RecA [Candidatus Colwellbacteria bacterium GWA2_46_10]